MHPRRKYTERALFAKDPASSRRCRACSGPLRREDMPKLSLNLPKDVLARGVAAYAECWNKLAAHSDIR